MSVFARRFRRSCVTFASRRDMKFDDDRGAAAAAHDRAQRGAVGFDEQSRDGEPQTEPAAGPDRERLCELAQRLASESVTVVIDGDAYDACARADANADVRLRVARSIVEQVDQHLQHPLAVHGGVRAPVARETQTTFDVTRLDGAPCAVDEFADVGTSSSTNRSLSRLL